MLNINLQDPSILNKYKGEMNYLLITKLTLFNVASIDDAYIKVM